MKTITLVFDVKTGEARVEANGFQGQSCKDAAKFLEESLGTCKDFQQKAEWFQDNLETSGTLNTNYCG
jgi:transposase